MLIKKLVPVEAVLGFTCDRCRKSIIAEGNNEVLLDQSMDFHEGHHICFVGGYTSVFGDGTKVQCDLCQECLHDLIKDFCRIENSVN